MTTSSDTGCSAGSSVVTVTYFSCRPLRPPTVNSTRTVPISPSANTSLLAAAVRQSQLGRSEVKRNDCCPRSAAAKSERNVQRCGFAQVQAMILPYFFLGRSAFLIEGGTIRTGQEVLRRTWWVVLPTRRS